jgi:DNA-binding transcriptional ArsR family regulator
METNEIIDALGSLAQETRLAIFRLLVQEGPEGLPAGVIATTLGVPNATLSFHLNHLSHAGLLESRRAGRSIVYAIRVEGVRGLVGFLVQDCCGGKPELCGLPVAPCCPPVKKGKRSA